MKKWIFAWIIAWFLAFLGFSNTYALDKNALTYWDLLSLYFWALAPDWNLNTKPDLKFTNIETSDSLYFLLEKAVSNNKFPNLAIELPLDNPAYESDLALLIKNNFNKDIVYTDKKVLSFDFLLNNLKNVYKANTSSQNPNTQKSDSSKDQSSWAATSDEKEIADQILTLLKYNYINKNELTWTTSVDYDSLWEFVESLGEDYTVYYTPEEWKKFMENLNWEFAWIGVYLIQRGDENPVIHEVIKDSPAEKADLRAEDVIISIDWKKLNEFDSADAFIDALKWPEDTIVTIEIRRGNQYLTKHITRDIIQVPAIESTKIWWTCYFNIYSFDLWFKDKFFNEFNKLSWCEKYVFDIRSNPGGVIDEVTDILDKFLPKWKLIMTEKWVNDDEKIYSEEDPTYTLNKPTYILIDSYTASAAEIFAWVLKHYNPDTVKLVGSQSFGKWSVQQVVQFPNDAIIKYTIAVWYIADNKTSIDKIWLTPDINVVDNPYTAEDEVLKKIWL